MAGDGTRRVAVVTGAANGIGAAVAERLRADGMLVVGIDREPCDHQPSLIADVADIDGHTARIDAIAAERGPVWALVSVAGLHVAEPVEELTVDAYRLQLGVMLDGPIWLARAAGLHMAAHGGGRILNVTSIHAANSERGSVAYDAAKAGLEAATRTLAIELGDRGVLVNSLAPGFVRTRMSMHDGEDELASEWFRRSYGEGHHLPLRRAAEPAEIAAAASFLVSDDNTYTTGARLVCDGGLTITF